MSEVRRWAIRLTTNYIRLAATLAIGLVTAPILLHTLGADAAGLVNFLIATVAVSELSQRVIELSMSREFSTAYHSGDRQWFESVYSSAAFICVIAALVALVVFAVILVCLPLFNINPPSLLPAARWFVLARAVEMIMVILTAPQINYFLATERMVVYNLWIILRRACSLLGALGLLVLPAFDPGPGVIFYGWASSGFVAISCVVFALVVFTRDKAMIPRRSRVNRRALHEVVTVGGWNTGVMTALLIPEVVSPLLMNLAFGLVGNLIWGYAFQLAGYIRMTSSGMTTGLASVTARITSEPDHDLKLKAVVFHATRLHGLMGLPAMAGLMILAEPILRVWVANRPNFPPDEVARAVTLIRLLAVAWGMRSVSEGWMVMLYGAGHVRRYAPWMLAAGLTNPLLALALMHLLPEPYRYLGPAWAFTVVLSGSFFVALPLLGSRWLRLNLRDMYGPLLRPALAVLFAAIPVALARWLWSPRHDVVELLILAAAFTIAYAAMTWLWVLSSSERGRLAAGVVRTAARLLHRNATD
ncbi:MAG: hypothetical protein IT442_13130 [Phycisphaeraceae bacterium]|nr:hypothetical protein [Phycisphaeraceae bacterium]